MSRPRPRYSWPAGAKARLRAARDHAAALTGPGAAAAAPGTARRLRAAVLGPHGGRPTRRRASDAFRFGFAIVVAAGSSPVPRASPAFAPGIVHALNPLPPAGTVASPALAAREAARPWHPDDALSEARRPLARRAVPRHRVDGVTR
jgi:hypothetical protein